MNDEKEPTLFELPADAAGTLEPPPAPDGSRRRGNRRDPFVRYSLDAEARAVRQGHRARLLPDGTVLVKAHSRPGNYRIRVERTTDAVLWFHCDCPSGQYRAYLPVPCKHAAVTGRRLERDGLATWREGTWFVRARPRPHWGVPDWTPPGGDRGSTAAA